MFLPTSKHAHRIIGIILLGALTSTGYSAQTINVGSLSAAPTVDGSAADWSGVEATTIELTNNKSDGKANIPSVAVKAGVYGDSVYFLMEWADVAGDEQHKPFVWDEGAGKYVAGEQREDRLAVQFAMSGDYDVNWLSGKLFTADTWHWKAARSNGLGIAQDKRTVIGGQKVRKAYETNANNGSMVYIRRPSDEGSKLYKTTRYAEKQKAMMPKYILADSVSGSVADVKAKGLWKDGKWTLEMSRKLDTGHADDVVFVAGQAVAGGIAIFDQSGNDDHCISDNLTFQY